MGSIFLVLLTACFAFAGYRRAKRAGLWSWPKFFFSIGFLLFETLLVSLPLFLINMKSPYFWPVYAAGWVAAAVLFVWFMLKARKWKLGGGRTSLQAEQKLTGEK